MKLKTFVEKVKENNVNVVIGINCAVDDGSGDRDINRALRMIQLYLTKRAATGCIVKMAFVYHIREFIYIRDFMQIDSAEAEKYIKQDSEFLSNAVLYHASNEDRHNHVDIQKVWFMSLALLEQQAAVENGDNIFIMLTNNNAIRTLSEEMIRHAERNWEMKYRIYYIHTPDVKIGNFRTWLLTQNSENGVFSTKEIKKFEELIVRC